MKVSALVLGLIGGIGGFIGAIIALTVGAVGGAFGAEGADTVTTLGWVAIPFAILGIIGGALSISKPKAAGIIMLISGVGGIICISAAYIFGGVLLIVGGILALVASRKPKSASPLPNYTPTY